MDENKCQTRVRVVNGHNPFPVAQPGLILEKG